MYVSFAFFEPLREGGEVPVPVCLTGRAAILDALIAALEGLSIYLILCGRLVSFCERSGLPVWRAAIDACRAMVRLVASALGTEGRAEHSSAVHQEHEEEQEDIS